MVTIYTSPGCMPCRFSKKRLTDLGVPFQEVDLSQDEKALEYVKSLGYSQAPVVVTADGDHWTGLVPERIDALAA